MIAMFRVRAHLLVVDHSRVEQAREWRKSILCLPETYDALAEP